jgi:hypothetical protein
LIFTVPDLNQEPFSIEFLEYPVDGDFSYFTLTGYLIQGCRDYIILSPVMK